MTDCPKPAKTRGMCGMHAERVRKYGTPELPDRPKLRCLVGDCQRPHNAKGLCTTHYERVQRTGTVADPIRPTAAERFAMYRQRGPSDECWEWSGPRTKTGYGVLVIGDKHVYAHRLAYTDATGDPATGLQVMHSCDNPPCCNPAHLSAGSAWSNTADKVLKGRQQRGEQVAAARLTEDSVRFIRANFRQWSVGRSPRSNAKELAQRFGVSPETVRDAARGATWRWLD